MNEDIEQLESQVDTLKELLNVYEKTALEQSHQLENAIHELQERTRLLEHSETTLETLQSILDSMGDSVFVSDFQGKFLFVNPAARRNLNILPTDIYLESWVQRYKFYLSDQTTLYPDHQLPWEQVKQDIRVDAAEIFMPVLGKLENIWFSVNAKPLSHEADDFKGSVVVFRNITNRKKVEHSLRESKGLAVQKATQLENTLQQLHDTQTQLIQTEKMSSLGQLVAGVAHEINNPISFIHGNLKHLQQYGQGLLNLLHLYQQNPPVSPEQIQAKKKAIDLDFIEQDLPKLLNSMESGTLRIQKIVEALRNFSRLDEAELKTVDIHEGLDSTLMILNHRLQSCPHSDPINIIKNYQNLPQVECYAGQMNQVFMNIFINAIEALEDQNHHDKMIQISTEKLDNRIKISIRDNGPGVNQFALDHIFDPFFTTKPIGQGTGLGMSISYQIVVKQHRGTLNCLSNIGQGAEFMIEIPLTQH